mgnify:CR=1 FL=1
MATATENRAPRNTAGAIAKAAAGKTAANSERATMQRLINRMSPEVAKALPKHISVERFTRMALSAVSATPALAKCTPESFLGAYLQAAQLGVEPNTPLGQAYLIPYTNNRERRTECTFQLGYKGLLDLAYRSGQVVSVQSQAVYENDEFEYQLGLHPDLKHVPARHDRGEAIAYYAVVNLKDGGYIFEVMSADDVRAHAKKFSQAYSNGPWQSNFDSMAKKTVLKKCLNLAPLSADTMRTIAADESIKTDFGVDMTEVAGTYVVDDDTGEVVAEVEAPESEGGSDVRAE